MLYRVLRDFRGSQDGVTVQSFEAGTEVEISEMLAPHISAWAVPADEQPAIENKAVITDPEPRKMKRTKG